MPEIATDPPASRAVAARGPLLPAVFHASIPLGTSWQKLAQGILVSGDGAER